MPTVNKALLPANLYSLYLPGIIITCYLVLGLWSMQYDDITYDESPHLRYGINLLKGNPGRSMDTARFRSTMPVTALNALPRAAVQILSPGLKKNDWGNSDIRDGRYITLLVSVWLLLYTYYFATGLTDPRAGVVVLALVAFDPNLLAHARLVTTDMYAALGFIATIYHLWKWLEKRGRPHFFYCCLAIALAQVCKPVNILLYPVCGFLTLTWLWRHREAWTAQKLAIGFLVFMAIQILIINASFEFSGPWGYTLSGQHWQSHFFKVLQSGWLGSIPVPFSRAYTDAFDLVQYERETFSGTAYNYLLGELRYKQGFWNYYLVCYGLKTPLFTLLITLSAILYGVVAGRDRALFLRYGLFPCTALLLLLSSSSVQNGYRYLLPVTILLIIFSAFPVARLLARSSKLLTYAFLAIPFVTVLFSFPGYLVYSNALLQPKKMAYQYLADSNFNWGQRRTVLKDFLKRYPDYIFEPEMPFRGHLLIDLNHLAGITDPGRFRWLRENYRPLFTVEGCYLAFDTTQPPGNAADQYTYFKQSQFFSCP